MCRLTRTREQQCTSEIWICSRQRSSSRILRQSCLQQNSAKIMGAGLRGLKVKNRILSNVAKTHTLQHGQPRVYCSLSLSTGSPVARSAKMVGGLHRTCGGPKNLLPLGAEQLVFRPKNPNCEVCRLHADSAQSPTSPLAEKFGDLTCGPTTRSSMKRANRATITGVRYSYNIWPLSGFKVTRAKQ